MPTFRLEETAGFGGRFEGYGIDIHYYDTNGKLQFFGVPSSTRPTWALDGARYEGRSAFLLELRERVAVAFVGSPHAPASVVVPRPQDWLGYVRWTLFVRDDLGQEGVVEGTCQPSSFDSGPGDR